MTITKTGIFLFNRARNLIARVITTGKDKLLHANLSRMRIPQVIVVYWWRDKESTGREIVCYVDLTNNWSTRMSGFAFTTFRVKSIGKEARDDEQAPRKVAHKHTGELFLESPFWSFVSNTVYRTAKSCDPSTSQRMQSRFSRNLVY